MTLLSLVLALHILCGSIALLVLAVPFLARWGGRVHKRVGWIFALAMGGVSLTAWILSALRLLDGDPANNASAIFLAHVGLLSASSVWTGVRTAQLKRDSARHRFADLAWPGALVLSSVSMLVAGTWRGDVLWIVFSVIGFVGGIVPLRFLLSDAHGPREWMAQHLSAMGTAAISAVTAFFVVNTDNLGLQSAALVSWIAPGVIGGAILSRLASRVREHGLARPAPTRMPTGAPSKPLETELSRH